MLFAATLALAFHAPLLYPRGLSSRAAAQATCSADVATLIDSACARAAADVNGSEADELAKQNALAAQYSELELRGFGSATNALPAPEPRRLLPEDQLKLTGLPTAAFAPPRGNGLLTSLAGAATVGGILAASSQLHMDPRLLGGALAAAFVADRALLGGTALEVVNRALRPSYRRTVIQHEAGHLLVAYLLGCPVQDCLIDPWAALRDGRLNGAAGVVFFDPVLGEGMRSGRLRGEDIDRFSMVVMAGIAAEAMANGKAVGGQSDERALIGLLGSLDNGRSWDLARVMNQARWGSSQALLLLREHALPYAALVAALERGASVGEAVAVIEDSLLEAFGRNGELPTERRRRIAEEKAAHTASAPTAREVEPALARAEAAAATERTAEREREIAARLASIDERLREL